MLVLSMKQEVNEFKYDVSEIMSRLDHFLKENKNRVLILMTKKQTLDGNDSAIKYVVKEH